MPTVYIAAPWMWLGLHTDSLLTTADELCPNWPLDTFPRSFPVNGKVANLLRACYKELE